MGATGARSDVAQEIPVGLHERIDIGGVRARALVAQRDEVALALAQCRNGGSIGGVVIIKKGKGGKFSVDAETFGDPLWGNPYCAGGGDFTMGGAALLSANGRREWKQRLTRRGHLLVMEEIEPAREPGEERAQRDQCGANGSLDGTFFPVRGPKPSYGDTIGLEPRK